MIATASSSTAESNRASVRTRTVLLCQLALPQLEARAKRLSVFKEGCEDFIFNVAGMRSTCSWLDRALVLAALYLHARVSARDLCSVSVVTGAWKTVVRSPTITWSTWV